MTTRYAYDAAGRMNQLTYPSGRVVTYRYEKEPIIGVDIGASPLVSGVQHQPFGSVRSWRWGNGASYERKFDLDGALQSYTLGHSTRQITRDDAGNIARIDDSLDPTLTQEFDYDSMDRVTDYFVGPASTLQEHYEYDPVGNRTSTTIGGQNFTYTYMHGTDFVAAVSGPVAKQWAPNGTATVISDGTRSFKLDSFRRIAGVINGPINTDYLRNGLQQRVTKRSSDGSATHFVYDEAGQLLAEIDKLGNTIVEHVWLGSQPIGVLAGDSVYYVFADHLSTPRLITDSANRSRWSWHSTPFGSTLANSNPAGLGSFTYNQRFPGQYYDVESGLHYNYYRDYDPQTGRYIQSDPIGLAGGINTYAYVGGNPVAYTDFSGLAPGDPYRTEALAAVAAIRDISPRTAVSGNEWGGRIYQMPNGKYSYTEPVEGNPKNMGKVPSLTCPNGGKSLGMYHTHPNVKPHANGTGNPNIVSGGDQTWGDLEGAIFIGAPNGNVLKYTANGIPYGGPVTIIGRIR